MRPRLMGLAGWIIGWGIRLLFRSQRMKLVFAREGTSPYDKGGPEQFLFCVWHENLLFGTHARKSHRASALVSRHRDGSLLDGALQVMGLTTVRGSSSRGGTQAVREMIEITRSRHVAISPDGPRGPRRRLKEGIVFLSSRTGCAIVPCSAATTRPLVIRGRWTDLVLPKPFSRTWVFFGEPIHVPAGIKRDGIEEYTRIVQQAMDDLTDLAASHGSGPFLDRWATTDEEPVAKAA
ncbi:MAG: lysophospholipid acyltransferase family protein [Planctomycetaceae bacterium]